MHYKTQYNLYRNGLATPLEVLYEYQEIKDSNEKEQLRIISLNLEGQCSKEDLEGIELHCWIETDIRLAHHLLNSA